MFIKAFISFCLIALSLVLTEVIPVHAQLSQLEFEDEVKETKKQTKKVKKTAKEEVEPKQNFSYSGTPVALKPINNLSFVPASLKGVQTDKNNKNAITSSASWKLPRSKDCSVGVNENAFLQRGVALKEVLKRFSGSNDFFDASMENICADKCKKKQAVVTNLRLDETSSTVLSEGIVKKTCRYVLEKPKNKDWKTLKLLNMTCSCINSAKAKKALSKK